MKNLFTHPFRVLTIVAVFCMIVNNCFATVWTTSTAGPITTLSNWTNGVSAPTTFTTPGDTWTITLAMTLSSTSSWTVGTASSALDTVKFNTGGSLTISGAGGVAPVNIYGNVFMNGGTLSLGGAGTTANANVYGNLTLTTGTISSTGASSHFYVSTYGDFIMSGGTVTTSGAASGIMGLKIHGNYIMTGGVNNANGAGSTNTLNFYGNCSFSGASAFTNTGAGCYNYIHFSLPRGAGTMLIDNTSTGTWSGTKMWIDTNCHATLDGNFSLYMGAPSFSDSFGLKVDGILECPAAYVVNGSCFFRLNGYGTLIVGHGTGINGAILTTGSKAFNDTANYGFNGMVAQVTGSLMPVALFAPDTIMINNSAGVTLSQSISTTGTLAFTSGILNTSTFKITTPGAAASVTGAGATSYVNGTLSKTDSGYTNLNYEVGDLSYTPMLLVCTGVADTAGAIAVKVTNGLHPSIATSGFSSTNIVNHYWTISSFGASGTSSFVPEAIYSLADILGGTNNYFMTQIYNGSAWLGAPLPTHNTLFASAPTTLLSLTALQGDYIFGRVATTLDVNPLTPASGLTVFPNPSTGTFSVNLSMAYDETMSVVITNVLGETVKEISASTNRATEVTMAQPAGIYLLSAHTAHGKYSARVLIK